MKLDFIAWLRRRLGSGRPAADHRPGYPPERVAALVARLRGRLSGGGRLFPRVVMLETRTRCNGSCGFCIASARTDPRPDTSMPDALIDRILTELGQRRFAGRLSFYHSNEPLLDKRIFDLIGQARRLLPWAYLELKTNGKTLTLEKVERLFERGLDTLYINDYRTTEELAQGHSPNVRQVMEALAGMRRFKGHYDGTRYYDRIIAILRSPEERLLTRAGSSPNRDPLARPLHRVCLRPFEQMIIGTAGQVGLCAEDVLFEAPMGDARQDSLEAIWNGPAYRDIRGRLLDGDRGCLPTCARCDYLGHSREIFAEEGL
ncbi:MAG: SPASM domain-containing protein [Magnetococcales bacterium]|nr:SPASM domain-containing protein [Magnetococcales bacterium]